MKHFQCQDMLNACLFHIHLTFRIELVTLDYRLNRLNTIYMIRIKIIMICSLCLFEQKIFPSTKAISSVYGFPTQYVEVCLLLVCFAVL